MSSHARIQGENHEDLNGGCSRPLTAAYGAVMRLRHHWTAWSPANQPRPLLLRRRTVFQRLRQDVAVQVASLSGEVSVVPQADDADPNQEGRRRDPPDERCQALSGKAKGVSSEQHVTRMCKPTEALFDASSALPPAFFLARTRQLRRGSWPSSSFLSTLRTPASTPPRNKTGLRDFSMTMSANSLPPHCLASRVWLPSRCQTRRNGREVVPDSRRERASMSCCLRQSTGT